MGKEGRDEQEEEQILEERDEERFREAPQLQAIVYGQSPIQMRCPYCLQLIKSQIILKPELITVALGVTIFAIVPNFMMMMLIILLLQFTSSRKHRCPLCQRQLGSDGKFLIYFTDQVYSYSLFSAGFIFTKKMMMTLLLIVFAVSLISLRSFLQSQNKFIATSWEEYLGECGKAEPEHCLGKYRGKEFKNWEGYLLKLEDNRQYQHKWYQHAISLYLRMEPSLNNNTRPDTLVTLNSDVLTYYGQLLRTLRHGDHLRFNCSLHERQRGSLKDVMHFHVAQIEVIGHNPNYAIYNTQIEQQWIRVHVQDRGKLRSEPDQLQNIKPT